MMHLFNDVDDFLHGNPEEKFFQTMFNANRDIVMIELEKMFKKFVAMEILLEEKIGSNYEFDIQDKINEQSEEIDNQLKNLYIEKMGQILSQSE